MSITIITSTLNALPQLKYTADSIFQQSSTDWQWVIVDGASEDGTQDWLHEIAQLYPNIVFISEPDNGVYDAWNKALPLLRGEWVLFLGAGDKFKSSDILKKCEELFLSIPVSINLAYGWVEYIHQPGDKKGVRSNARWEGVNGRWSWCRPILPNHQGVFHRKVILKNGFDTSFRVAGDAALMLPELMRHGALEVPFVVTLRLMDGISLHPKNRALVLREFIRINRHAGLGSKRWAYQYLAFLYHVIKSWILLKSGRFNM